MSLYDYEGNNLRQSRQPSLILIVILMLMSAFLGGLVAYAVAPAIFGSDSGASSGDVDSGSQGGQIAPAPIPEAGTSSVVAIAQNVSPAVVGITNFQGTDFFSGGREAGSGTGFIIDGKEGLIVTNNHVIAGAQKITVTVEGKEEQFEASVVGSDARTDLAVLKIDVQEDLPEVKLGDSSKLQVGESVVAIGNPLGHQFSGSVTVGVVSALDREVTVSPATGSAETTLNLIQTDAAINPGNSGGPLVNMRGEVIGINSVKIAQSGVEGMGFSIPIGDARPVIEEITDSGHVSRPFIGIYNFQEITDEMSEWYDMPTGIYVGGIVQGSPASRAGIRAGDIIVEMDGTRINSFTDLDNVLEKHEVGDTISIALVREGNRSNVSLTLGETPKE